MNLYINENKEMKPQISNILKFAVPSLTGVFLFLIPLRINSEVTLLLNYCVFWFRDLCAPYIVQCIMLVYGLSALGAVLALFKPNVFQGYFKKLFFCSPVMALARIFAFILIIVIYLKVGPELIWSMDTGGSVLYDLVVNLAPFFLFAGPLLPLLTEYGFMEFVGVLLGPVFRPIFKLPGRAAVHFALALVASSTISAALAGEQYEKGYYTAREAVIMGTGFSVSSVPTVALFAEVIGMSHMFLEIYIAFILAILLINIIMVRIPPISRKADVYLLDNNAGSSALRKDDCSYWKQALDSATAKAGEESGIGPFVSGLKLVGDIWFTLFPQVLLLGTAAMLLVNYTPVATWLSYPFIYLLQVLQIPEAAEAAPAMIIGFFDAFLPVIVGLHIESEITRFVIVIVALVQIIFMTSVGPVLLQSKIPLNFRDLLVIFIIRTLISIPIAAIIAYLIF